MAPLHRRSVDSWASGRASTWTPARQTWTRTVGSQRRRAFEGRLVTRGIVFLVCLPHAERLLLVSDVASWIQWDWERWLYTIKCVCVCVLLLGGGAAKVFTGDLPRTSSDSVQVR